MDDDGLRVIDNQTIMVTFTTRSNLNCSLSITDEHHTPISISKTICGEPDEQRYSNCTVQDYININNVNNMRFVVNFMNPGTGELTKHENVLFEDQRKDVISIKHPSCKYL